MIQISKNSLNNAVHHKSTVEICFEKGVSMTKFKTIFLIFLFAMVYGLWSPLRPLGFVEQAVDCYGSEKGGDVLTTREGEPIVCAYFFGHWWEPWKSNDDAIRTDLKKLKSMGFNTILVDHEWSQMKDRNWYYPDREQKLAKETGMYVVPWLEAKCGVDIGSDINRIIQAKKMYGVRIPQAINQAGKKARAAICYSPEFKSYMVQWVSSYIDRYLGTDTGNLLMVKKAGKVHPVVSLCVEAGWDMVSFDTQTNEYFREWAKKKYKNIDPLNSEWGTSYKDFSEIDPRDTAIFDYSNMRRFTQPKPVEDHILFRAELCSSAFADIKKELLKKYPDMYFMAELPYQFDCGRRCGDYVGYKWQYAALPEMIAYADMLLIRSSGDVTLDEYESIREFKKKFKMDVILTHRTHTHGNPSQFSDYEDIAKNTLEYVDGLGIYSWNEMVDCHTAVNAEGVGAVPFRVDEEKSAEMAGYIEKLNKEYVKLFKK